MNSVNKVYPKMELKARKLGNVLTFSGPMHCAVNKGSSWTSENPVEGLRLVFYPRQLATKYFIFPNDLSAGIPFWFMFAWPVECPVKKKREPQGVLRWTSRDYLFIERAACNVPVSMPTAGKLLTEPRDPAHWPPYPTTPVSKEQNSQVHWRCRQKARSQEESNKYFESITCWVLRRMKGEREVVWKMASIGIDGLKGLKGEHLHKTHGPPLDTNPVINNNRRDGRRQYHVMSKNGTVAGRPYSIVGIKKYTRNMIRISTGDEQIGLSYVSWFWRILSTVISAGFSIMCREATH